MLAFVQVKDVFIISINWVARGVGNSPAAGFFNPPPTKVDPQGEPAVFRVQALLSDDKSHGPIDKNFRRADDPNEEIS